MAARKLFIAPSLLSADFSRVGEEIAAVEAAGADMLHVDVMDGRFVPNITIGPFVVEAIKKAASVPLDVHLMIADPDRFLEAFARAGADILTVHQEACPHLHRTVHAIRDLGMKAGVSLNPATPVATLEDVIADVDLVLVMSVNPGFAGQRFIERSYEKVRQVVSLRERAGRGDLLIEVDGGVSVENVGALHRAGMDMAVSGSAVFSSDDYAAYIASMRIRAAEHTG